MALIIGFVITSGEKKEVVNLQGKEESILFEGKPSAVFKINEDASLSTLQINVFDIREASYLSLELDENSQRINKKYLAVPTKVFNSSMNTTEVLLIGLIDNHGNTYKVDQTASAYISDMKGFGRNMNIFPRIIQEGYLFFTDIDENAKKMQLIFAIESTKEKIAFEFNR